MDSHHRKRLQKDLGNDHSPEVWARRLRGGDPAADRVVRARVQKILAFGRLAIPADDRPDLEQEIMTEVWQAVNRPGFDFEAGFWGFVEVITSRRCIDWIRARHDRLPLLNDPLDDRPGPFEHVLDDERARLASQVLGALRPECREIIDLRLHHGLSYGEIAKRLGKSVGSLRVQMYRCIRSAREIVKKMDPWAYTGVEEGGPDGPS